MLDALTLQTFRDCLADHAGQPLTAELCAILDSIVRYGPDRSISPDRFDPRRHGRYQLRAERFSEILAELHELHVAHWSETERHRHALGLKPDYEQMIARERAGQLIQFTARAPDGEMAAQLRMYIANSTHTQTLFAEEDTLYVCPPHRQGLMVMGLLRYAEAALRSLGVREIRVDSKLTNDAHVLMARMGYQQVSMKFHKFFEE